MQINVNVDWRILGLTVLLAIALGAALDDRDQPPSIAASTQITFRSSLGPPDYDSGWFTLARGSERQLTHNLGTEKIFVYMIGSDNYEVHNQHTGGEIYYKWDSESDFWYSGARWFREEEDLNAIIVRRLQDDSAWEEIRVWIWSFEPTYDGGALVTRGTDNGIYYRIYKTIEDTWSEWIRLPGATAHSPTATVIDNALHILVIGLDDQFYHGSVDLVTKVFSGWTWISGTAPDSPDFTTIPDFW